MHLYSLLSVKTNVSLHLASVMFVMVGLHVPPPPPQTLAVPPPPQVCGEVQVPHEDTVRLVPQLSLAVTLPQFLPSREQNAVLLSGVQVPPPQTLAVP